MSTSPNLFIPLIFVPSWLGLVATDVVVSFILLPDDAGSDKERQALATSFLILIKLTALTTSFLILIKLTVHCDEEWASAAAYLAWDIARAHLSIMMQGNLERQVPTCTKEGPPYHAAIGGKQPS